MGGAGSDDELANTATAVGTSTEKPAGELGATLGRYRLERRLGEGGMGVVHAAFDPDLERRVALKVLRTADGGDDARLRLLREARAMARLTHANVVTVHEVGSASGRDYVAMELVDGESLADWLRAEPRPTREIIAAFVAAGRGLAAAHAAGLVHRDFKPHNVLRRRDGGILVTDFGLARGVETAATVALEATQELGANTPSSLSGLTRTGSVVGTPAYMAPEQWLGGTVGPAADQFAFCVALWEALAGERPFRGDTAEALRAAVQDGGTALDASKLPRRLRVPLRRGLHPDPSRRFAGMDALLARIVRAERRPIALAVVAAGIAIAAAGIWIVARPAGAPPRDCEPPALDVAAVWPATAASTLTAAGRGELGAAIDRDVNAWRTDRDAACSAHRTPQLQCLDGVLARIALIRVAVERVPGELTDDVLGELVDPAVCMTELPPRLVLRASPDATAALALALAAGQEGSRVPEAEPRALAARPNLEPCARVLAQFAFAAVSKSVAESKTAMLDAIAAAEACGDDRLRAEALLAEAPYEYESPFIGAKGRAALARAQVAVDRVAQPDLVAEVDQQRARIAAQDEHWDEAFAADEAAIQKYAARGRPREQLAAVEAVNGLRFRRNGPGDMEAVRASIAKWRPAAVAAHDQHRIDDFDLTDAFARLFLGDVEGAHPELLRAWHPRPDPDARTQRIEGVVVDDGGKPVAGATVAAATSLWVDSLGPFPFARGGGDGGLRITTTDATGAFAIPDVPMTGAMIAQQTPALRSAPTPIANHVRLVVAPTRRLAGRVELGTVSRTKTFVMAMLPDDKAGTFVLMSPIAADGRFSIAGATTRALKIAVTNWGAAASANVQFTDIPAAAADLPELVVGASSTGRTLDVVVRSTVEAPFSSAQVFLAPAKLAIKTFKELTDHRHGLKGMNMGFARPILGATVPKAAIGKTRSGDVIAHFENVSSGDITACAIGFNGSLSDPEFAKKISAHAKELESACASVGPDDTSIVIEAPPQKRWD